MFANLCTLDHVGSGLFVKTDASDSKGKHQKNSINLLIQKYFHSVHFIFRSSKKPAILRATGLAFVETISRLRNAATSSCVDKTWPPEITHRSQ